MLHFLLIITEVAVSHLISAAYNFVFIRCKGNGGENKQNEWIYFLFYSYSYLLLRCRNQTAICPYITWK